MAAALGTDLGYEVPDLVEAAGLKARYVESLERSKSLHDALAPYFPEQARTPWRWRSMSAS